MSEVPPPQPPEQPGPPPGPPVPPPQPPQEPPNFSNYPRNFGVSYAQQVAVGPISSQMVNVAFQILSKNLGIFAVQGLIMLVINYAFAIPDFLLPRPTTMEEYYTRMILIGFVRWFVVTTLAYGWIIHIRKFLQGLEPLSPMGIFTNLRNVGSVAITTLVVGLATVAGCVLLIIPGIYLYGRLAMAPVLASQYGLPPMEAIQESWKRCRGDAWNIFWVNFLGSFATGLGVCLFFVGLILTYAISPITVALMSLNLFPSNTSPDGEIGQAPPGSNVGTFQV